MPQHTPDQADMSHEEAAAAHLAFSHLPKKPDADDGNLEGPGGMPIARSLLTAAFMFFIAFAAWLLRWPVFTVAFCVAGVVFLVSFFSFGNTLIRRALGRVDEADYPTEPWAYGEEVPADVAERVARLGGYLADPNDPAVRMRLQPLPRRRREACLAAREAEAESAWEWASSLPDFSQVEMVAEDGARLVAHELACAPRSRRWLVFAHDCKGRWGEGMPLARRFAERGYNLLFLEMRGHRASGGAYIGLGWLDRRDLLCWVRDLAARHGDDVEVVLMGQAMGALAACLAAGEADLPSQVRAIVSDSGCVDTWNLLLQRVRYTGLEPHPTADFARLMFRARRGGYDLAAGDAESAVAAAKVPCLFLHGRADALVPAYHSARLYMAAGGREAGNRLVTFPRAGHCTAVFSDPEAYFAAIWEFLDQLL